MKILGLDLENGLGTGLLVGVGALLVAPVIIPVLAGAFRPLAKAAIKGGYLLFEKGKVIGAETQEMIEDIAAEAKAEVDAAKKVEVVEG